MANGLTISQLKICYGLFVDKNSSFYLKDCHIQQFEKGTWKYYLLGYPDNTYRLLFSPITLYPKTEPFAEDLNSLILFYQSEQLFRNYNITRLIVPIGEVTRPIFFPIMHHMVTLIIDFLPKYRIGNYQQLSILPPIKIKIVDSFRFSIPMCHQTEEIIAILDSHFDIREFNREYVNHQNLLDRHSCCYFALKVIHKALIDTISDFTDNIYLSNLSPMRPFVDDIPMPDTWIVTSRNWLTENNKQEVTDILINYYQQQIDEYNLDNLIDEIVEC